MDSAIGKTYTYLHYISSIYIYIYGGVWHIHMCRGNLHSVTVNVKYLAVAQATPLTCLIDLIECGRDRVYHIRIKHGNVGQGAGG